jgi:hypothetical protein
MLTGPAIGGLMKMATGYAVRIAQMAESVK